MLLLLLNTLLILTLQAGCKALAADYRFFNEVRGKLPPHLRLIDGDVLDISRRIREIDETLFIVFNLKRGVFEIHSTEHYPTTYAWTVPYERLDERTLRKARENNLRVRGAEIFRDIDRHNERLEASLRRQQANDLEALAKETRSLFAEAAWR